MANSLLGSLIGAVRPDMLTQASADLGLPDHQVAHGLETSFASIVAGLAAKSGDAGTMRRVFEMATSGNANNSGPQLLSALFGDRAGAVGNTIAQTTGMSPEAGTSVLMTAAPIVLGVLGSQVHTHGWNLSGFADWIGGQRDNLLRSAPPGVRNILGIRDPVAQVPEPPMPTAARPGDVPPAPRASRLWLWPLAAAVLLLAVLWNVLRRPTTPETAAAGDVALSTPATPAATPATPAPTAFVDLSLPNGQSVHVPTNGTEARLVAYLGDPNMGHGMDTTWFEFDRLHFNKGAPTLDAASDPQLHDMATIFAAYPTVHATIGGYTDNTGDADANQRLSQQRASTVVTQLVALGVTPERLTAKGYGAAHPVADNASEAGRAQNRRIAVRVTER